MKKMFQIIILILVSMLELHTTKIHVKKIIEALRCHI